jgi:uncharacterized protein (TIGR02246 family)
MKTTFAVILCVLLLLFSACATKVNDPTDVAAIKKSMTDFEKALNAADANGIAAVMTDKTIFADLNVPAAIGKEAIRSQFQAFFDMFKADFSTPVEDVRVAGDLGVARGTWTNKLTPKAEGIAPITYTGSWMVTFARQSDGSWKWDWCVPNGNQPSPGSTASGEDEKALYQLERDWVAAIPKKDTAVVEKFLANDFVSNNNGRTQNRRQILDEIRSNPAKIESAENQEMNAMVFGDRAVVNGIYVEKSTTNGKDSSQRGRYTEVYVKRNGRWLCVTQYATKVQ